MPSIIFLFAWCTLDPSPLRGDADALPMTDELTDELTMTRSRARTVVVVVVVETDLRECE